MADRGTGDGSQLSGKERALQMAAEVVRKRHGEKAAQEFLGKFQTAAEPAPAGGEGGAREPTPQGAALEGQQPAAPAVRSTEPAAATQPAELTRAEEPPEQQDDQALVDLPRRNPRQLSRAEPAERATRRQRRLLRKLKRGDMEQLSRDRRLRGDDDPGGTGLSRRDYRKVRAALNDASGRAAGCRIYQRPVYQAYQLVAAGRTPRTAIGRRSIGYTYLVQSVGRGFQVRGKKREWFSALLADPHNERLRIENDCRPSARTFSTMATALDSAGDERGHIPEGLGVVRRWQVPDAAAAPEEWLPDAKRPTSRYQLAPTPVDFDVSTSFAQLCALLGDALPETREDDQDAQPPGEEPGEGEPGWWSAEDPPPNAASGTGPPASA